MVASPSGLLMMILFLAIFFSCVNIMTVFLNYFGKSISDEKHYLGMTDVITLPGHTSLN